MFNDVMEKEAAELLKNGLHILIQQFLSYEDTIFFK